MTDMAFDRRQRAHGFVRYRRSFCQFQSKKSFPPFIRLDSELVTENAGSSISDRRRRVRICNTAPIISETLRCGSKMSNQTMRIFACLRAAFVQLVCKKVQKLHLSS